MVLLTQWSLYVGEAQKINILIFFIFSKLKIATPSPINVAIAKPFIAPTQFVGSSLPIGFTIILYFKYSRTWQ